jgi:hypothetical protein
MSSALRNCMPCPATISTSPYDIVAQNRELAPVLAIVSVVLNHYANDSTVIATLANPAFGNGS